jgi:predicted Zn-dependent protease
MPTGAAKWGLDTTPAVLTYYDAMQKLEPPDTHYLFAAIGWLELGNPAEARAEIAQVSAAQQEHPDVLEVRWSVSAEQKRWEEALETARVLLRRAPKRSSGWLHQAYALRRVPDGGIQKAWEALLPAVDKFPKEPTIPFNLSCYACQMQQLAAARDWLQRAVAIGGKEKIHRMALQDSDLEPLWTEIREL